MTGKTKGVLAAVAAVAAIGGGAAAIAGAAGGAEDGAEGPDKAITGSALDKASAAALDHSGGGQVTDTEVGDEESYYEIEVTRDDGSQLDVQLDRSFQVVGDEADEADGE
jgi:uncharacterized membrane protein YkoI